MCRTHFINKESWIFNLTAAYEKLRELEYRADDGEIQFPITVADTVLSSSSSVDIENTDQFAKWAIENHHADFVKVVPEQYKPDKKEIGKYMKDGGECPFAEIKTKRNMQIK